MSLPKDATDLRAGPSNGALPIARAGHDEALREDAYAAQVAREAAAHVVAAARAAEARAQRAEEDLRAVTRALAINAIKSRRTEAALSRAESALTAAKARHPDIRPPSAPLTWADHSDVSVLAKSELFDARFYAAQLGAHAAGGDLLEHYVSQGWRLGLNPGPYFHTAFYLTRYPDIADTGRCPLAHYVRRGAREMRDPHPLFDAQWYVDQYPDARAGGDPLQHYLRVGAAAGADPHPMFSVAHYLDRYGDLKDLTEPAFAHFLRTGAAEGRTPHPMFDPGFYRETYAVTEANPLVDFLMAPAGEERRPHGAFDTAWYRDRYADARVPGVNAAVHFLKEGEAKGYRPNPIFDPDWYNVESKDARADDADLPATAEGLFFHYLERGGAAGLRPHPLFEPDHYREQAHTAMEPLAHFLTIGGVAGLSPHPLFDANWYLRHNPVVAAEGRIALVDYIESGSAAGRNPNPIFDLAWYRAAYDDVRGAKVEPLAHYSVSGEADGRKPHLLFDPAHLRYEKAAIRTLGDFLAHTHSAWPSPHALFDVAFYSERYPDVSVSGRDPLSHFLHVGAAELRDCCPLFDAAWYATRYENDADPTLDPLSDYLRHGWKADRWPNRYFDPRWYHDACAAHGQVLSGGFADLDPLSHYLRIGRKLDLDPHPLFDGAWYARRNPESRDFPGGPLAHFLRVGEQTDIAPNALFDPRWYRRQHPLPPKTPAFRHYLNVGAATFAAPTPLFAPRWYAQAGENSPAPRDALAHYIHRGEREGRRPNPHFDPVEYRARRAERANTAASIVPAPATPLRWKRDAAPGAPGKVVYVSIVAFTTEMPRARLLARSIRRFNPDCVLRLTLLDAPTEPLSHAEDVFDEVQDLAGLNMPALKPWLFGLNHATVGDGVRLAVLQTLLDRHDCAAVVCAPTGVQLTRSLSDLLTPLAGAAVCIPYQTAMAGVDVFAMKPHHDAVGFVRYLQTASEAGEGVPQALMRAPLERDGIHLLNERRLIADPDNVTADAMFLLFNEAGPRGSWTYDTFDNGAPITDGHRALYRDTPELRARFPDPYATGGDGGLHGWAMSAPGWRGTAAAATLRHETELAHYIEVGGPSGLAPAPWFDEAAYLARYPDVAKGDLDAFAHFVVFGAREGRDSGPGPQR